MLQIVERLQQASNKVDAYEISFNNVLFVHITRYADPAALGSFRVAPVVVSVPVVTASAVIQIKQKLALAGWNIGQCGLHEKTSENRYRQGCGCQPFHGQDNIQNILR